MRTASHLRLVVLLLVVLDGVRRADGACSVKSRGILTGEPGVHTETLRPGQRGLVFTIPLNVCQVIGVRAVACDTAKGVDGESSDAENPGGAEAAPYVMLEGRRVKVARRSDADTFAMLSVEIYCEPT